MYICGESILCKYLKLKKKITFQSRDNSGIHFPTALQEETQQALPPDIAAK
jgi:hypothetical protein